MHVRYILKIVSLHKQIGGPQGSIPYQTRPMDKPSVDSPRGAYTRPKGKEGKGGVYGGPLGEKSKLAPVHQGKG